ncbi:hypothetical protein [Streptomyces mesophilus]|uniref:hypothetical protein n=1 Tax=Streptomyces mesophilus TaxID=1775132 RepID=UPI003319B564
MRIRRHPHSALGDAPDQQLTERAGIGADILDTGCCGLAGNSGFEHGRHDQRVVRRRPRIT